MLKTFDPMEATAKEKEILKQWTLKRPDGVPHRPQDRRRQAARKDRRMKKTAKPAARGNKGKEFKKEPEVYESTVVDGVAC